MSGRGYLKFRNDRGVPEICIGVREFECIGESPPQDHPHVYINMGEADAILCPYCGTRFRFDPRLTPLGADPPDSLFVDQADEAPAEQKTKKRIILLSDGTGNSERSPFKTNVWRTYQALKLAPGEQIAYYDNGVGTSTMKPLAVLGGAFGWGLKRNVIGLYKFLCRTYEPGDLVYGFGFSRGAFTIRVLVGLIDGEGLVRYRKDDGLAISEQELTRYATAASRAYRKECYRAPWAIPAIVGRLLRDAFLAVRDRPRGLRPYDKGKNIPVEEIRYLGLWDTVDAYGIPIRELKSVVDHYIWPLSFRSSELSDKVKCARHALALDDERATFHPLIWNELGEIDKFQANRVPANRIRQVWFAGAHANVGGGYPDDGLAYVPLLWILEEACGAGLEFEPELIRLYKAVVNRFGRIYDSRAGRAAFYRYSPRRIDRSPERPYTNRPLVASTVFERMTQGQYAPISIHGPIDCIGGSGSVARQYNGEAMELVRDTVWWRRTAYWVMVLIAALILGFPWLAALFSSARDDQLSEVLSGFFIFPLLKMVTPAFAARWIDAFARFPSTSSALLGSWLLAFGWGLRLRDDVADRARFAWQIDPAAPIDRARWIRGATRHPISVMRPQSHGPRAFPFGFTELELTIARFFRTNWLALAAETFTVKQAIPFLFIVGILLGSFYAANWLAFAMLSAAGAVCVPTEPAKQTILSPGAVEMRRFDIADPCFATGIRLAAGAKYRIIFTHPTDWHDAAIDVASLPARLPSGETRPRLPTEGYSTFEKTVPLYMAFERPMLRLAGENWLKPIARLGVYGHEEYVLGPNSTLIEPQRRGELFLYVNEPVLGVPKLPGVPSLWNIFYSYNSGLVTVEIRATEAPASF